jgi:hypothetical protein
MLRVSTHTYSDGTEHVNVDGRYIEKTFFFYSFEYRMFYVLYQFVTYLLTLRRMNVYIFVQECFSEKEKSFSSMGLRILDKMTGETYE